MIIEEAKEDVRKSISHARNSAKNLIEGDIDCRYIKQLTSVSDSVSEARGMTLMLTRHFAKDAETEELWKDITDISKLYYKGKERFLSQCQCIERDIKR